MSTKKWEWLTWNSASSDDDVRVYTKPSGVDRDARVFINNGAEIMSLSRDDARRLGRWLSTEIPEGSEP